MANIKRPALKDILKELLLCFYVAMVLLMMDRSLENIYPFFLYATGKRIIDLWISFEMHMHVWLKWIIPAVFLILLVRERFRLRTGLLLPILGIYLLQLLTSVLTSGYTFRWWNTTELPLMMYLFLTVQCSTHRGIRRLAFTGNLLYSLLLMLNAVFIFFPQLYDLISGWAPEYFLSADNLTGFPMIFGLLLAYLDGLFNNAVWRKRIYYVLFFLNLILIHCASALMAGLILAVYFLFPFVRKLFRKTNFNYLGLVSVLFCAALIAVSWFFYSSGHAPQWLYDLTRQKRSIMIRMIIWCGVFGEVLAKPLLGYGLGEDASFFLRPDTSLYYNAHNAYLQTWHESGLLTLSAVFAVLALFATRLKKCADRELAGFFSVLVFSEIIMMQTAITSWFTWCPLLLLIQTASLICISEDTEIEDFR